MTSIEADRWGALAASLGLPREHLKRRSYQLLWGAQATYPEDRALLHILAGVRASVLGSQRAFGKGAMLPEKEEKAA